MGVRQDSITNSDARLVRETGLDARIAEIVEPAIEYLGYRLVRVQVSGLNGLTVQIMAERPDGTMGILECEEISRDLSPLLDVEDPVKSPYHLEVSSPGIDRPLVRQSDFMRWCGQLVKVELSAPDQGRRRYRGLLLGMRDHEQRLEIGVEMRDCPMDTEPEIWVPVETVREAKLIMTETLIKEAANIPQPSRQKSLRKDHR